MILKRTIFKTHFSIVPETDSVNEFVVAIGQKYMSSDKAKIEELLDSLIGMKYDNVVGFRAYMMKIMDIATKLTELKMPIVAHFLVHYILNSLLP